MIATSVGKQGGEAWMPTLASKSRHLASAGGRAQKSLIAALEAEGAEVLCAGSTQAYYEMRLEDALLSEAGGFDAHEGGRLRYLAHRLLSHQFGHRYTPADVERVECELQRLRDVLADKPAPPAAKTPGKKEEKAKTKPKVRAEPRGGKGVPK